MTLTKISPQIFRMEDKQGQQIGNICEASHCEVYKAFKLYKIFNIGIIICNDDHCHFSQSEFDTLEEDRVPIFLDKEFTIKYISKLSSEHRS
jgi:hypothetical protein